MGAGENPGADGGVFVEGFESCIELEDEGGEEGVEGFGAVELDCCAVLVGRLLAWRLRSLRTYSCQRRFGALIL